jgi:hypothetical protein
MLDAWKKGLEFISGTFLETLPDGSATFGLVMDKCNIVEHAMDPSKDLNESMKHASHL